jgi:hypothetical protein
MSGIGSDSGAVTIASGGGISSPTSCIGASAIISLPILRAGRNDVLAIFIQVIPGFWTFVTKFSSLSAILKVFRHFQGFKAPFSG